MSDLSLLARFALVQFKQAWHAVSNTANAPQVGTMAQRESLSNWCVGARCHYVAPDNSHLKAIIFERGEDVIIGQSNLFVETPRGYEIICNVDFNPHTQPAGTWHWAEHYAKPAH